MESLTNLCPFSPVTESYWEEPGSSIFIPVRCQDLPQVFSSPRRQVPALSASHTWSWARVAPYILQVPGSPVLQMDPHQCWEEQGRIISPSPASKALASVAQGCIASSQSVWQFAGDLIEQDFAFPLTELCLVLQPVEAPLKGSTSAGGISYSLQLIWFVNTIL